MNDKNGEDDLLTLNGSTEYERNSITFKMHDAPRLFQRLSFPATSLSPLIDSIESTVSILSSWALSSIMIIDRRSPVQVLD